MSRREYDHEGRLGRGADQQEAPQSTQSTGPHYGRGPRNYRGNDERIREEVSERLADHGDIDASDVEVIVENREVTLVGTVTDRAQKRLAEDVAERVRGVADVHNRLRVRLQDPALSSTIVLSGGDSTNLSTPGTTMTSGLDDLLPGQERRED